MPDHVILSNLTGLNSDAAPRSLFRALMTLFVLCLLSLGACGKLAEPPENTTTAALERTAAPAMSVPPPAPVPAAVALDKVHEPVPHPTAVAQERYIAVRHELQIEAPADQLVNAWSRTVDACRRLDCELLTSQLQHETAQTPVSASLSLRVAPNDYATLTQAMGGDARVISDSTSSEDKTVQVIDVEAHLKNRADYRDSLRDLLKDKSVKRSLDDLLQISDTLADVQAEIDSAQSQRKLLEQETSKSFVQMTFTAERALSTATRYHPWLGLWSDSVNLISDSTRSMVRVLAMALPWVLLVALLVWPLRAWLRRHKQQTLALRSTSRQVEDEAKPH
jgi:hypothetical protein